MLVVIVLIITTYLDNANTHMLEELKKLKVAIFLTGFNEDLDKQTMSD